MPSTMRSTKSRIQTSTFVLLVVCLMLSGSHQVLAQPDSATQDVIVQMFDAIPDLQRIWNVSAPEMLCSFRGISCVEDKIIELDLANLGLSGILPAGIFSLLNLTKLDLSGNQIQPPNGMMMSGSLKYVSWSRSNLSATPLRAFCDLPQLVALDLHQSNLSGTLPPCLANLTNLQHLDLQSNALMDNLPDLRPLVEMRNFSIGANRFIGSSFPTFFCGWSFLEVLDLGPNLFNGNLPSCLMNLTNLVHLSISRPNISTTLQSGIPPVTRLQRLRYLQISGYGLPAPFPDWVTGLASLQFLDLSRNQLEGPLPDLSPLRFLKVLKLDNNRLNGTIPSSLLSLGVFDFISLAFNQFSGPVPEGLLHRVANTLILSGNSLTGCLSLNGSADISVTTCDATANPQLCGCSIRICGVPPCSTLPPFSDPLAPKSFAPAPLPPSTPPPSNFVDPLNLVIVSPTIFSGDLRLNHSFTVTIYVPGTVVSSIRDPILRVTGCVLFAGVLRINVPVSVAGTGERRLISFDRGYCDGFPRTFAYVRSSFDELDCSTAVVSRAIYEPHSVSVDFGPARNVCLGG
eukprot:TRINITY_DN2924_c0_g1_i1.p1 TRINITY_DN2924_c0_g1~~TRINITY_DN2924_c0_g1_i1.p1  ORF type:complete len:572 (+),score=37.79 TRINITY_DN2924_c0_g1_i1:256-1971(+)